MDRRNSGLRNKYNSSRALSFREGFGGSRIQLPPPERLKCRHWGGTKPNPAPVRSPAGSPRPGSTLIRRAPDWATRPARAPSPGDQAVLARRDRPKEPRPYRDDRARTPPLLWRASSPFLPSTVGSGATVHESRFLFSFFNPRLPIMM